MFESEIMSDISDEYWSADGETFNYDTLGELLDCNELSVGDTVYIGSGTMPDPAKWVDADDVIDPWRPAIFPHPWPVETPPPLM